MTRRREKVATPPSPRRHKDGYTAHRDNRPPNPWPRRANRLPQKRVSRKTRPRQKAVRSRQEPREQKAARRWRKCPATFSARLPFCSRSKCLGRRSQTLFPARKPQAPPWTTAQYVSTGCCVPSLTADSSRKESARSAPVPQRKARERQN